jgi:hypothetical protein
MNSPVYVGIVLLLCIALQIWLKHKALYVICVFAFVQNFLIPWLYTIGKIGIGWAQSMLLFKEFLLLMLFVYLAYQFAQRAPRPWPRPLMILVIFTAYCVVRAAVGALFFQDDVYVSARKIRMAVFPLEMFTVGMAARWMYPKFTRDFLRKMTFVVAGLALAALWLFYFAAPDFWSSTVNIATYNIEVKGDDPLDVAEAAGVTATGLGRGIFLDLSSFRAMGTFGDPLAMGFAQIPPILLLAFYFKRNWLHVILLAILMAALFFTFSRSAWIFLYVATLFVLLRRRKLFLFALAALVPIVLFVKVPQLRDFAAVEMGRFSWENPGSAHAEGITWFYQYGFTDPGNILGKGMSPDIRKIPESGYAFLLEHFGLMAYVMFIWFLLSFFIFTNKRENRENAVLLISQAMAPGMLVVMHFAEYPFSFIGWVLIWFMVGASVGASVPVRGQSASPALSPLPKAI